MLRVSAVKELPALSRTGDAGALDCEGTSDDRRVADASGASWSRVVVENAERVVIGDTFNRKSRWLPERKLHTREVAAGASTAAPAPGRLSYTAALFYHGGCRRDHPYRGGPAWVRSVAGADSQRCSLPARRLRPVRAGRAAQDAHSAPTRQRAAKPCQTLGPAISRRAYRLPSPGVHLVRAPSSALAPGFCLAGWFLCHVLRSWGGARSMLSRVDRARLVSVLVGTVDNRLADGAGDLTCRGEARGGDVDADPQQLFLAHQRPSCTPCSTRGRSRVLPAR